MGTGLGAAFSKWLGAGDYRVGSNSLVSKMTNGTPAMHSTSQSIVVRHKEYICDVYSSTGFAVSGIYPLNPGVTASFPWLSSIAQQYQEYTIKGMVYHYVPTSGESVSSANTSLGSVILATNYRASDSAFTSKVQMLNEYFAGDSKPSETFCHPIECDPKENPFNVQYVRTGAVPAGQDPKIYDLGTVYLATVGQQQAGNIMGELWASYEVELRKPVMAGAYLPEAAYARYSASTGNINTVTPLSNATMTRYVDTFVGGPITIGGSSIVIPPGNAGTYAIVIGWVGATACVANSVSVANGSTFTPASLGALWWPGASATTNTNSTVGVWFVRTSPANLATTITVNVSTLVGASAVDVGLFEINSSFL